MDFIQLHKFKIILDLNMFLKDGALNIYPHRFILLAHFNMPVLIPRFWKFLLLDVTQNENFPLRLV